MDIKTVARFNEWWITGKVSDELFFPFKRYLFLELLKHINSRQMVLLAGLRRVGKTVLMYQLIDNLLKNGVMPKNILYFSFDETGYNVNEVIENYQNEILRKGLARQKIYFFFDEIQKAKDWANQIKIWYDLYPQLKFFLSGSASLSLEKKSRESLAGRLLEFVLKPLTFQEFLSIKNIQVKYSEFKIYQNKILPLFIDYLRKSGFPEIVDQEDEQKIKLYIKNSVIDRIIYKDLPLEFGIKDLELLGTLLNLFFTQPGIIVNFDNLSRDLKRDRKTVMNYIYYLRYSLLLRIVLNFRKGVLVASRKMKKIYPSTTSFIFSQTDKYSEMDFSKNALETFVVNELNAEYYYRKNGEVDIIYKGGKNIIPIEVKNTVAETDIKQFKKLMDKLECKKGIIVSREEYNEVKLEEKTIIIIPAWAFALFKEEIIKR